MVLFVFMMACGGVQSEGERSADHDDEPPARATAQTSPPDPEEEERAPVEYDDEVTALEGEDFSGAAGETSGGGTTTPTYSVARGHSGGSLRTTRHSSTPHRARRARRAAAPETLDARAIEATIDEHAHEVHFCYEREFRHRPDVSGRIVVAATIAPDGHVSEAHIASSTIRSSRVDQCVIRTFSRWVFPRAQSPTTLQHPFTLTRR